MRSGNQVQRHTFWTVIRTGLLELFTQGNGTVLQGETFYWSGAIKLMRSKVIKDIPSIPYKEFCEEKSCTDGLALFLKGKDQVTAIDLQDILSDIQTLDRIESSIQKAMTENNSVKDILDQYQFFTLGFSEKVLEQLKDQEDTTALKKYLAPIRQAVEKKIRNITKDVTDKLNQYSSQQKKELLHHYIKTLPGYDQNSDRIDTELQNYSIEELNKRFTPGGISHEDKHDFVAFLKTCQEINPDFITQELKKMNGGAKGKEQSKKIPEQKEASKKDNIDVIKGQLTRVLNGAPCKMKSLEPVIEEVDESINAFAPVNAQASIARQVQVYSQTGNEERYQDIEIEKQDFSPYFIQFRLWLKKVLLSSLPYLMDENGVKPKLLQFLPDNIKKTYEDGQWNDRACIVAALISSFNAMFISGVASQKLLNANDLADVDMYRDEIPNAANVFCTNLSDTYFSSLIKTFVALSTANQGSFKLAKEIFSLSIEVEEKIEQLFSQGKLSSQERLELRMATIKLMHYLFNADGMAYEAQARREYRHCITKLLIKHHADKELGQLMVTLYLRAGDESNFVDISERPDAKKSFYDAYFKLLLATRDSQRVSAQSSALGEAVLDGVNDVAHSDHPNYADLTDLLNRSTTLMYNPSDNQTRFALIPHIKSASRWNKGKALTAALLFLAGGGLTFFSISIAVATFGGGSILTGMGIKGSMALFLMAGKTLAEAATATSVVLAVGTAAGTKKVRDSQVRSHTLFKSIAALQKHQPTAQEIKHEAVDIVASLGK